IEDGHLELVMEAVREFAEASDVERTLSLRLIVTLDQVRRYTQRDPGREEALLEVAQILRAKLKRDSAVRKILRTTIGPRLQTPELAGGVPAYGRFASVRRHTPREAAAGRRRPIHPTPSRDGGTQRTGARGAGASPTPPARASGRSRGAAARSRANRHGGAPPARAPVLIVRGLSASAGVSAADVTSQNGPHLDGGHRRSSRPTTRPSASKSSVASELPASRSLCFITRPTPLRGSSATTST
ncbi:MAG: hypothetical protein QOF76_3457, partial [Solirubrobacteraceae bacterium]|nr:hypothetical protein [Solirubrobacteraceae bacterium]